MDGNSIAVVSTVIVGVLSVGGFSWRISRSVSSTLKEYGDEEAIKRKRVYERLDEVKKEADDKYTPAAVCEERHKRVDEALVRIEGGISYLVKRNGGG